MNENWIKKIFLFTKTWFSSFLFFPFLIFTFTSSLFADTLILKNKKIYRGKVTAQSETSITFKTSEGQQLSFQKKEVLKVVYKDLNETEAKKVIQEEEKKIGKNTTLEEKKEEPPSKKEVTEEPSSKKEIVEESKEKAPDKRTWFSIFWRSALIPGWGQFKAERYYSAGFSFLITMAVLSNSVSSVNNLSAVENNYRVLSGLTPLITSAVSADNPDSSIVVGAVYNQVIFSSYKGSLDQANNSVQLLALVYGAQLIHAFFVGRQWEKEGTPENAYLMKGWKFSILPENQNFYSKGTYQMHFNYTFSF